MENLYFKQNIKIEPTINDWYAWALLFSPITNALITSNYHIAILKSYLQSPSLHDEVALNSDMKGGPFVDFQGKNKTIQIQSHLEHTLKDCSHLLEFALCVNDLSQILKTEAVGHSLETLYDAVPARLKGYVELFYDLKNSPGFRLFEPLIYKSEYFMPEMQKVLLSVTDSDKRPFLLSTPIISDAQHVVFDHPFSSSIFDDLFRWKEYPVKRDALEKFSQEFVAADQQKNFLSMFSTNIVSPNKTYNEENKIRIRYFGHACILIEAYGISILVDPLISYSYEASLERYTFLDLPASIDYVLISHAHQDHFVLETLLQLRYKIKNIIVPKNNKDNFADASLKLICQKLNFKNIIELDELDIINFEFGSIMGVPFLGEHGDLNIHSKLSYLIQIGDKRILCIADSNNFENKMYEHIQKEIPKIDVMFIGMECDGAPFSWLYGPMALEKLTNSHDQSRRLDGSNADKAFTLINTFDCQEVYIYAMGQEPWLSFLTSIEYNPNSKPIIESNKLLEFCNECEIKAERPFGKKEIFLVVDNN